MRFKVGDRVRIKNFDWFRNEGAHNMVVIYMEKYYGEVVTIESVHKDFYRIKEDDWQYCWTDEMIECKVEEETLIERVDDNGLPFNEWLSHKGAFYIPDGYELKDENGNVINATKIFLEKKSKKSPKTDDIIKWLRKQDMTKYIGVIYSGMCSITFDTEGLIKDFLETVEDNE